MTDIVAQLPIPTLCKTIKALLEKSDGALDKAEQFAIAAGQHIHELKDRCPKEWVKLAKEKIGIGRRRSYEIMAIADGRKTLAQVRAQSAKTSKKHRIKNRASRDAQSRRVIGPIDRCAMAIRKIILEYVEEIKPSELSDLFAALRDELDDLEKVADRRKSNGHHAARQSA